MPVISRFYGLVVKMYFGASEHNPPHFHVSYGEYAGIFDIQTLQMMEGDLPAKAQALIQEWAGEHKDDLQKIWDKQEFIQIPPLE